MMAWSLGGWLKRKPPEPRPLDDIAKGMRAALARTMNETAQLRREDPPSREEIAQRIEDTAAEGRRLMTGDS